MHHDLKTVQPYFERAWSNEKPFELRLNDRDFQKGDTVNLKEYDKETDTYSGRALYCTIQYVLKDYPGIESGYCIFGYHIDNYILPQTPTT